MTYNAYTTLNEIWRRKPRMRDWEKLLAHLGKTEADDEPLHFSAILDCLGMHGALWFLRVKSLDRLSRHFQAWREEHFLHLFESALPGDTRLLDQIAMLRNDDATDEQREAARAAVAAADAAAADATAAWGENDSWVAALDVMYSTQEAQLRAMIGTPSEGTNQ